MGYPSCLLSWWDFNRLLLEEAKLQAIEALVDLSSDASSVIQSLDMEHLSVETLSETVVHSFAGNSYFSVLDVLDGTRTNANHRALAELARLGKLRAVVTTNFDTLIEQAFRDLGVPLDVYNLDPNDRRILPNPNRCDLYKVHGSVTNTSTLIDTVSQKLQALPLRIRSHLANLYAENHVLVLGYSGTDLVFDQDRFAFAAITDRTPGITWLARPGAVLNPRAQDAVNRAGIKGTIINDTLPQFFGRLGLGCQDVPTDSCADSVQAAGREVLRIRQFLSAPGIGPLVCAAFCVELLNQVGNEIGAHALCAALANHPEFSRGLEFLRPESAAVYLVLSTEAARRGDFQGAVEWCRRSLAVLDQIEHAYEATSEAPSPEILAEWSGNRTTLYNNLGLFSIHEGQYPEARSALERALQLAWEDANIRMTGVILRNLAELELAEGAQSDRVLWRLRAARTYAADAGDARTLCETRLLEAEVLINLAEYDTALEVISKAEPLLNLAMAGPALKARLGQILTAIDLRRGDVPVADQRLRQLIDSARLKEQLGLAALLRRHRCLELAFHRPLREELLRELDDLIASTSERPNDGPFREQKEGSSELEGLRKKLQTNQIPDTPRFLTLPRTPIGRETALRYSLAQYEFDGEPDKLSPLLLSLCKIKYYQNKPDRVAELARAAIKAAIKMSQREEHLSAVYLLGTAEEATGYLDSALTAYQQIIEADPPTSPVLRACAREAAGGLLSRLGSIDAERYLVEAVGAFEELGSLEIKNLITSLIALTNHYTRVNDTTNAARTYQRLTEVSSRIQDPDARTAAEKWRPLWEQRIVRSRAANSLASLRLWQAPSRLDETSEVTSKDLDRMRMRIQSPGEIANLGLIAEESGLLMEAEQYFHEARSMYEAEDNLLGVSRCFNNFSGLAMREQRWHQAVAFAEQALALKRSLGDAEGEVLTLSNLAYASYMAGRPDQAIFYGRDCLRLNEGRKMSRQGIIAHYALILSLSETDQIEELEAAAEAFLVALPFIDDPDLKQLGKKIRTALPLNSVQPIQRPASDIEHLIGEAMRLKRIRNFEEALRLLDNACMDERFAFEGGVIEGTRGHILQSMEQHDDAIIAYQQAISHFRSDSDEGKAVNAEMSVSISMLRMGRGEEAEALQRDLLERVPAGLMRASVLQGLASTLLERWMDHREKSVGTEIREVYREAFEISGLDEETMGVLHLNASNIELIEGNVPTCLEHLHLAYHHFVRCNSPHLKVCADQIARVN